MARMVEQPSGPAVSLSPAAIDAAGSVAALQAAASLVDEAVRAAHARGAPIDEVMQLASTHNRRIVARLWALIAPPALVENSCLLVMGSEGRGEQILRTDQDNALLLRDGFALLGSPGSPGLHDVAQRFQQALVELGWPPCPGGIMLSNPAWCQPLASFRQTMRAWIHGQGAEAALAEVGPMHLAIFVDAKAVAGDERLLEAARAHLARLLTGADAFLARFALAADQFQAPGGWLARLAHLVGIGPGDDETLLDLKKLGIFPIVHGVRALALQYGIGAQGTADRLAVLAGAGRLPAGQADELRVALHRLLALRLTHQLQQRSAGEAADNLVRPAELGAADRQGLDEALAAVKRFRLWLRQHFKFDVL
jgi:CBS domain-containing protein